MLIIQSKELLKSLKKVKPVCGANTLLPVLSYVKLTTNEVAATNLNVSIIEKVNFAGNGEMLLPLNELMNACSLVNDMLDISPSKVTAGKDKWTMGLPEDIRNFPKIDYEIEGEEFEADDTFVWSLINASKTIMAMPENPLGNVRLVANGSVMSVYGTNGTTLYRNTIPSQVKPFDILIPQSVITCLAGLTGDFKFTAGKSKIAISNGTTTIIGTLSEGKYSNLDRLFEKREETIVQVQKSMLVHCLTKIASVYSVLPFCQMIFTDPEKISFYLNNSDYQQEAYTQLEIDHGVEFESITINANYLLNLLSLLPSEVLVINLHLADGTKPMFITAAGHETILMIGPVAIK